MKNSLTASRMIPLIAALAIFVLAPNSMHAQTQEEVDAANARVTKLFNQRNWSQAIPDLQFLVKARPNDPDIRYRYGFALYAKSKNVDDPDMGKLFASQALAEFKKAKELGYKGDDDLDKVIAILSTDSTTENNEGGYSKNPQANALMNKAESHFAKSEFDEAFDYYQKALALDPNIYEAALFSGDVFLQKRDFKNAEVWYQKAIAINPNRETAYRYSATPLMRSGKYDEALTRYIEAYITEPYNPLSARGITQWAEVTGASLGHPKIDMPRVITDSQSKTNIDIEDGDRGRNDGSFARLPYALVRITWQSGKNGLSEKFKAAYPTETTYRHSLAEEHDALSTTAKLLKEQKKPVTDLDPQLKVLLEIYDKGLLEAYILLARADEGIAADHPAYLKANREKLREYVRNYVIRN